MSNKPDFKGPQLHRRARGVQYLKGDKVGRYVLVERRVTRRKNPDGTERNVAVWLAKCRYCSTEREAYPSDLMRSSLQCRCHVTSKGLWHKNLPKLLKTMTVSEISKAVGRSEGTVRNVMTLKGIRITDDKKST